MRIAKLILGGLAAVAGVAYLISTSSAPLVTPAKIAVDRTGNLYIADSNNSTIDEIVPDGKVTIIAGKAGTAGFSTGKGSEARFLDPSAIAVAPDGSLVVADEANNVIYKISSDGMVTLLAGTLWTPTFADMKRRLETGKASARELADGPAKQARFDYPRGVAIDNSGNIYVVDSGNDVIRKITTAGLVTTVAGSPGIWGYKDGKGDAARFYVPSGIAVDAAGNLYVADTGNRVIRKITPDGSVSTLAGKAGKTGNADGKGDAARFYAPQDIAIGPTGSFYIVDGDNVRKITPDGDVSTAAGDGSQVSGFDASLPTGIAVDHEGNLYVADYKSARIIKISRSGEVSILAGPAKQVE